MPSDKRHWRESPARDESVPNREKLPQPAPAGTLRSSPPARATEGRVTVVAPTTVPAASGRS